VTSEMTEEEFAGEVADGFAAEVENSVIEYTLADTGGRATVPRADDDRCGSAADEVGVGGMKAQVVATLHEGGGDGVPTAREDAAVGHDEIAWVLMEERVEQNAGDDAADEGTAVVGAVALEVAADAGAVFRVIVSGERDASADAGGGKEDGISSGADGELELLAHGERRGVPDVAGVEVGKNAEDALMELVVELGFGNLLFGDGDCGIGGGASDGESDFGEFVRIPGLEGDVVDAIGFKARRANRDDVGAGEEIGKTEVAEGIGGDLLGFFGRSSEALGEDMSIGDETALNIADDAGDAAMGV